MRTWLAQTLTLLVIVSVPLSSSSTGAATAALALAALALAVHACARIAPRMVMVGARALAHAEPLSETPAPSHPTTAGRPLGRAPTLAIAAA